MERTYRAIADPTRRRILELLRDGDRTAGEIAAEFDVAWASVSHHLGVLRSAGLVVPERNGQFIHYSLDTTVFQDLIAELTKLLPARKKKSGRA